MITDKARKFQELKAICNDATYVPKTRIAAARRLFKLMDHSVMSTRIARRISKKMLKDPNLSVLDRTSALRLWETIMGAPTIPDPNMTDDTEGLMRERVPAEPSKSIPPSATLQQSAPIQTPPVGAVSTVLGSDGNWYFVDANRNNLGRAPGESNARPYIGSFPADL